ncbi:MAG: class I SAM-dependent methyltransferase [Acidobacteria bacterium]|nr:class I SAM-dependent methyltransferase [Acidobacteriota bacterium]
MASLAAGQRRRGGPGGEQQSPPLAKSEAEKRILATIDDAFKAGELYANVPAADGRMLRLLTESITAKNVVEIGTSTGISGLWICLALEKTGGRLNTFELDSGRAATARRHFQKAGVERLVNLVQGDAHQNIKRLKDPIDMLFLDAEKEGYVEYLQQLLPLVRPGGLILAHNIDSAEDYLRAVNANPDLDTVLYRQGGGMSITLKKR